MRRIHLRATALFLFLSAQLAMTWAGGEFWTDKPYTKWSEKESKRMLADSPWARTTTLRHTILKLSRRDFGTMSNVAGEGEGVSDPEVDYTVYLRTARPVREALVRMAQFEQKYDQMDDGSRKAFDAKWEQFLSTNAGDKVIVQVQYSANTADVDRQLANYWQTQTVETIRDNGAALTGPDGVRMAPVAFWTARGAGREFQMAFPRPKTDGKDAAISVEFTHPRVTGEGATRIYTKFPLKNMMYGGTLTY